MTHNCVCRVCGTELTHENWYPSLEKHNNRICNTCMRERGRAWAKQNPDKAKAKYTRAHRANGQRPTNENKKCAAYLGVHVAEEVLHHVFKDVKPMPYGNPGYDFICNRGKKIDVKSGCLINGNRWIGWGVDIRKNNIADYFLCLAFDNRDNLTPMHIWLLPGKKVCHLSGAKISINNVAKWSEYKLDISKVVTCCNILRGQ